MKYINIHTHGNSYEPDTLVIHNLYTEQYLSISNYNLGTVGMHPWKILPENIETDLAILQKAASDPKIIAIGETGLDKACQTNFELQKLVFEHHVNLAKKVNKPIVVHCVRSYDEILEYVIKNASINFMFHWFYADLHITKKLVKLPNTYFSFGHILLNVTKKTALNIQVTPLNRLFLETDDSGDSIADIYSAAAKLFSVEEILLMQIIKNNFAACYKLEI